MLQLPAGGEGARSAYIHYTHHIALRKLNIVRTIIRDERIPSYDLACILEAVLEGEDDVEAFETKSTELEKLKADKLEREKKADSISAFMFELHERDRLVEEFSSELWNTMIDIVTEIPE